MQGGGRLLTFGFFSDHYHPRPRPRTLVRSPLPCLLIFSLPENEISTKQRNKEIKGHSAYLGYSLIFET